MESTRKVIKLGTMKFEYNVEQDEFGKEVNVRIFFGRNEDEFVRLHGSPDGRTIEIEHVKHSSTIMFYHSPHPRKDD